MNRMATRYNSTDGGDDDGRATTLTYGGRDERMMPV